MTHKAIGLHAGNPHIWLIWFSGTLHPELYGLLLPTFSLLLVVTSHLVLEVFARQLLWNSLLSNVDPFLRNSHNIPPTSKISSFPLSLCHCLWPMRLSFVLRPSNTMQVPSQTLTLAISICSLRSWHIFSRPMSLIFHCSPQANDSQSINVFLCLPLVLD